MEKKKAAKAERMSCVVTAKVTKVTRPPRKVTYEARPGPYKPQLVYSENEEREKVSLCK
jgi:hypothetical protein